MNTNEDKDSQLTDFFDNLLSHLSDADLVVLELSSGLFNQGFLVKKALDLGKPVIALHHLEEKIPLLLGINDENMQVYSYTLESLADVLHDAVTFAKETSDIRFNLMLSSKLNSYLKWIARNYYTSRAAFVRKLIEDHLASNSRFTEK